MSKSSVLIVGSGAGGSVTAWALRKAGHPVLSELLRRIMRQEGRHIAFYSAQAGDR